MLLLLVIILFGILLAVFATQNTQPASITLATYRLTDIPMYVVLMGSLLVGVLMSWVLSLFGAASSFFTLRRRESTIHGMDRTIADLKRKNHDLEVENVKLRERKNDRPHFDLFKKPNIAE